MDGADPLGPEAVAALDDEGVLGEVLDLPEHLRDALWRVESAHIAPVSAPGGLAFVGVDGLQRGGELARRVLGDEVPLGVGSGIAAGTDPGLVLLASYSGEDAPVLEAFARAEGAVRVVLSTGGQLATAARRSGVPVIPLPGGFPQPLLAAGYALVATLELARLGGLAENPHAAVEAAASHVARLARHWGPDSDPDSPAKRLARAAAQGEEADWAPSPVEAGETPLEQVLTGLLLDNLVDLYTQILAAEG